MHLKDSSDERPQKKRKIESSSSKHENQEKVNQYVLAGHGSFEPRKLKAEKRIKQVFFTVPKGVTLIAYVPPGVTMDDTVGQKIQKRTEITDTDVILEGVKGDFKTVSTPYPYIYQSGETMIDYYIKPPTGLNIEGKEGLVKTVDKGILLSEYLNKLKDNEKNTSSFCLHIATCFSNHSIEDKYREYFPGSGYSLQLRENRDHVKAYKTAKKGGFKELKWKKTQK